VNNQLVGRIASAIFLAAVCAVAITKLDLPARDAMLRWLIFTVVAGLVVNSQVGEPPKVIAVAATLTATGLLGALLWLALLGRGTIPGLSGFRIDLQNDLIWSSAVLLSLWLATCIGVAICAYARPVTIQAFKIIGSLDIKKAKQFESALNLILSIAGAAFLAFFAFAR
jgi:hypothetical protein